MRELLNEQNVNKCTRKKRRRRKHKHKMDDVYVMMMNYYYWWIIMTGQPIRVQQLTAANGRLTKEELSWRDISEREWQILMIGCVSQVCWTKGEVWCLTTRDRGNKPKKLIVSWVPEQCYGRENRGAWGKQQLSWVQTRKGPRELCKGGECHRGYWKMYGEIKGTTESKGTTK